MTDNWNSLLADRTSSHAYSRLPTESPSDTSLSRQNFSSVDVVNVVFPEDEQQRSSRQPVEAGATLGVRVSKTPIIEQLPPSERSPGLSDRKPESISQKRTEKLVKNPTSCWRFVDASWFQALSAVVIVSNVITTIVEMDKPQTKNLFFVSDQVMLGFYVFELCSRVNYFGSVYLFGPADLVCWNVLDIIVVVAGVLDQWLLNILPVGRGGSLSKVLTLLRLLRLLRVFKIVRVFLDIDLSWTEKPAFQSTIGIVIVVNSLLMGVEIDIPWSGWFYFEQVLLCIYVFELSVRLKNFGLDFFSFSNGDIVWNILDFTIVTSSVLDSWITPLCGVIMKSISGAASSHKEGHGISLGKIMMLMRMLRLMRILRLAKLIKSIQPLYILVTGVMAALQGVVWVLVLTIVTLYAMGILATSLIAKKMGFPPGTHVPERILKPFDTVPNSMFTLFRVMSGAASEAESYAIDHLMENIPALKLCFVFFMITSSWTLLSILTAVVSDNMICTTGQAEDEVKLLAAEEDRKEHVDRLTDLFNTIDVGGDGQVERHEIETFLSEKKNAVLTARRCRVPVRDVREVLQTVADACEGTVVSIETFVDHLADVPNPVTQKSVMKLEAFLTKIINQNAATHHKLNDMLGKPHEKPLNNGVSTPHSAAEAMPKALQSKVESTSTGQSKVESTSTGQLQDVARLMEGLVERTEASLNEHDKRSQRLLENMAEALEQSLPKSAMQKISETLELRLDKMQHDLLRNLRGQGPDISKVRDGQGATAPATLNSMSDEESPLMQKPLIFHGVAGNLDASKRDNEEQPSAVDKNRRDVVDMAIASGPPKELSGAHMEARLLAIEESIHGSQQKTEFMIKRLEGPLEKMSIAGFSALAVEKVLASLHSELDMIKQELLLSPSRQSPSISKVKGTIQSDQQPAPAVETQADIPGLARAPSVPMEVAAPSMEERLLATEKSIHGLQQNAEAMLRKIEGFLEKAGLTTCALDKFAETLERELRMMRQEVLCSLRVSKVTDGLLSSPPRSPQKGME